MTERIDHEHHRHAAPEPARNPWKVVAIVLAAIIAGGLIVWAVFALTGGGAPGPTPTPSPTESSATPSPTPTPSPTAAPCTTDDSTVELGTAEGAAGSSVVPLIFTNTGSADCTLEGFPTVEFVGDGDGTQIGASATEDTATSPVALVTLAPGESAESVLTITTAPVGDCEPVDVDGFRVIPPGSNDAFFIENTDYQACDDPDVSLMTVSAIAQN